MRRGSQAEAERLAVRLRMEIGVGPDARIDVDELAQHVGIEVRDASELVSATPAAAHC